MGYYDALIASITFSSFSVSSAACIVGEESGWLESSFGFGGLCWELRKVRKAAERVDFVIFSAM